MRKITEEELIQIVDMKLIENKQREYKEKLDLSNDKNKISFARNIVAFTNTNGGHVIYGISEENGKAHEFSPMDHKKTDAHKLQIQQVLDTYVAPKIQCYTVYDVKNCLVITVNKSWNAPHAVIRDGGKYQFPYRTDSNVSYYDVSMLKEKFMHHNKLRRDIDDFIKKRLSVIIDNYAGSHERESFVVLYLIPINTFYDVIDIDSIYETLPNESYCDNLPPLRDARSSCDVHLNVDGIKITMPKKDQPILQLFRNGVIESRRIFQRDNKRVNISVLENTLDNRIKDYLKFYEEWGIFQPFLAYLNLHNMSEYFYLHTKDGEPFKCDRSHLELGSVEIQDDQNKVLEPLCRVLYNAFGRSKK